MGTPMNLHTLNDARRDGYTLGVRIFTESLTFEAQSDAIDAKRPMYDDNGAHWTAFLVSVNEGYCTASFMAQRNGR